MSRGLIRTAAFVVIFALFLLPVSTTMARNDLLQAGEIQTADVTEALARDAQEYAKSYGVDQQEAIRRLERQRPIGQLGAALEAGETGTYAGLWIQHRPDYRVIALFTRDGAQTLQRHVAGGPLSGVVEAREAKLTLLQLQAAQNTVIRALRSLGIAADSRINVSENRAEVLVTDWIRIDAALGLGELQLPDGVVIVTVPGLAQVAVSAGESNVDCTLGFSVSGPEGLGTTTAGHCGDVQSSSGAGLPFIYSWYYGPYDMQWHTSPFATVYSRAYDGVSSPVNYRAIVATSGRASQNVGDWVCKYGRTTGYGCGTIVSKVVIGDGSGPGNTGPMSATFIQVHQDNVQLSFQGDSGGPWFTGNTALGLMHAYADVPNGRDAFYMAVDYIQSTGLNVLVNCPATGC